MDARDESELTLPKRKQGLPKGTRIAVAASEQVKTMVAVYGLTGTVLTWRDVRDAMEKKTGKRMGLGTLHDLSVGKEPQGAELRKALGLPVLGLGAICPVHGKVCAVRHRLPAAPGKPRRQWKKVLGRVVETYVNGDSVALGLLLAEIKMEMAK